MTDRTPVAGTFGDEGRPATIDELLEHARRELGMAVAFVGRFARGHREIEAAALAVGESGLVGRSDPLDATLCRMVVSGEMEPLVPDISKHPLASAEPIVTELAIAAYMGMPLVLRDGSVHGTLCVLSHEPRTDLDEDDVTMLRNLAGRLVALIEQRDRDTNGDGGG